MSHYLTEISNVLVIGSGGAGIRAAIEIKQNNLDVKILGKRSKIDSHTVLAAGGINASFGNVDNDDSWEQHFADTYLEGYKIGDCEAIEIMAKNAKEHVKEIDSWGANFKKLDNGNFDQRYFGAHTYRRTCYSGDYTGQSILKALLKKAENLSIPIFDNEYVSDLLVKENVCFGAISFNIKSGEKTIHLADAVVLCTGGHTRIWRQSSSRKLENMGDGYFLGLKAGCELIDMEMVQFHPTGMLLPEEISGTLVTEAVRGEGGLLYNGLGERFMEKYDKKRMELSTRDRVAIANYTEIIEGRGTKNGGVYLDISHKDKEFIISKVPKIYRQFIESQLVDISKQPMEVAPTAHYSMGGLLVEPCSHKTSIEGLFAAGEVVGGLHGANRLGGNSLAEILIFGKIAGLYASKYSKNLSFQLRSKKVINNGLENILGKVKNGKFLAIPLQEELRKIMWKYCGVIKDKNGLEKGLMKIKDLKILSQDIDVRVCDNNFNDLVSTFDLKSSLICAEATMVSALNRLESRGAHNRKDYPIIDSNSEFNNIIKLENDNLNLHAKISKKPNNYLSKFLNNCVNELNLEEKLLE